ncbi:protein of unknown function [Streptococcus thermophilus]|uniref:CRISPR type III A-associated protein Csm5 n=1 Tax=Streptococcus thermophilus TaxID=1308 RepID=A0AAU9H723_STRTR|nr:protein of unknown function [Streptococcus thermophilus]
MKNDYRTFKLSLLTLAPIHIGNGEKYTSREFIYENKKFYFPVENLSMKIRSFTFLTWGNSIIKWWRRGLLKSLKHF